MMKKLSAILCLLFLGLLVFAQNENKISITEKADYRVYENGKYKGLTSREAKLYIVQRASTANRLNYFGEAFVLQKTKHNRRSIAKSIDEILKIEFHLDLNKIPENLYQPQIFSQDAGYPILRNFPILPCKPFTQDLIGKRWLGLSTILVKPIPENPATRIPILAEYEYMGMTEYKKQRVHYVKAMFGLRYKGTDEDGDETLMRSQGGRKVDIYLDLNNRPIFIRENINEDFIYADRKTIKHKGFILHFYSYADFYSDSYICGNDKAPFAPLVGFVSEDELYTPEQVKELIAQANPKENKNSLYQESGNQKRLLIRKKKKAEKASLKKIKPTKKAKIRDGKNFTVKETERGTVLNLKNLNFVADKAILLRGEEKKLDEIAAILKNSKAEFFMVEGHTADIGNYEGQKQLSLDRANAIATELIKRGIPASKIIVSGAGGTQPIAENDTESGRAKNRRVEITIF